MENISAIKETIETACEDKGGWENPTIREVHWGHYLDE